ncbi:MAG TPA: hypothetical protein EYG09_10120 [Dehalococcoidia bacterium]|nr:hypothetical protein [Dehalococcoidia bacterium]
MSTITGYTQSVENIETYQASNRFGILTVPLILIPELAVGIAAAFVIHQIWQWTGFYLMRFFPVGIGISAGFAMGFGSSIGKNRNVTIGIILGLTVGIVSYLSMHYFDAASYGTSDVLTYLRFMAEEGYVMIFIPISGPFVWISWVVELGIVVFFSTQGLSFSRALALSCVNPRYSRRLLYSPTFMVPALEPFSVLILFSPCVAKKARTIERRYQVNECWWFGEQQLPRRLIPDLTINYFY